MSETSLSPALSRAFEDRVDLGSWAGFTSSLARFLDEVCRPLARRGEAVEAVIDPSGGTLLLTAPVPMVKAEELVPQGRWSQLLSRLPLSTPPVASPDLPGVVLGYCLAPPSAGSWARSAGRRVITSSPGCCPTETRPPIW